MKKIRLGAGSAYWGDLLEPAVELADKGELDYLCFDHLSELVGELERWMRNGRLDNVAPGEPTVSEPDLRSFLEASEHM